MDPSINIRAVETLLQIVVIVHRHLDALGLSHVLILVAHHALGAHQWQVNVGAGFIRLAVAVGPETTSTLGVSSIFKLPKLVFFVFFDGTGVEILFDGVVAFGLM
jgi:hypothetical protein